MKKNYFIIIIPLIIILAIIAVVLVINSRNARVEADNYIDLTVNTDRTDTWIRLFEIQDETSKFTGDMVGEEKNSNYAFFEYIKPDKYILLVTSPEQEVCTYKEIVDLSSASMNEKQIDVVLNDMKYCN